LDLLAVPAAHLATGVPREEADAAVVLEERRHRFRAAAEDPPGCLLALVAAEADRGAEGERRILAEVVVGRGVPELDRAGLHGVEHLQPGHALARGERPELELAVVDLADPLADLRGAAVERIQALAPARRHPPRDL